MSLTWNWNYLWTGISVIASGITIYQAWDARKSKKATLNVQKQIKDYFSGNEITKIIQSGSSAKKEIISVIAKNRNSKTDKGRDNKTVDTLILTFLTSVQEHNHLIKEKNDELMKILKKANENFKNKDYESLQNNVSDLIQILNETNEKVYLTPGE